MSDRKQDQGPHASSALRTQVSTRSRSSAGAQAFQPNLTTSIAARQSRSGGSAATSNAPTIRTSISMNPRTSSSQLVFSAPSNVRASMESTASMTSDHDHRTKGSSPPRTSHAPEGHDRAARSGRVSGMAGNIHIKGERSRAPTQSGMRLSTSELPYGIAEEDNTGAGEVPRNTDGSRLTIMQQLADDDDYVSTDLPPAPGVKGNRRSSVIPGKRDGAAQEPGEVPDIVKAQNWRASVFGIKGSVETHQRRLKERQEVMSGLRAWADEVLGERASKEGVQIGSDEHIDAEQLELEEEALKPDPTGVGAALRAHWQTTVQEEVEMRFNQIREKWEDEMKGEMDELNQLRDQNRNLKKTVTEYKDKIDNMTTKMELLQRQVKAKGGAAAAEAAMANLAPPVLPPRPGEIQQQQQQQQQGGAVRMSTSGVTPLPGGMRNSVAGNEPAAAEVLALKSSLEAARREAETASNEKRLLQRKVTELERDVQRALMERTAVSSQLEAARDRARLAEEELLAARKAGAGPGSKAKEEAAAEAAPVDKADTSYTKTSKTSSVETVRLQKEVDKLVKDNEKLQREHERVNRSLEARGAEVAKLTEQLKEALRDARETRAAAGAAAAATTASAAAAQPSNKPSPKPTLPASTRGSASPPSHRTSVADSSSTKVAHLEQQLSHTTQQLEEAHERIRALEEEMELRLALAGGGGAAVAETERSVRAKLLQDLGQSLEAQAQVLVDDVEESQQGQIEGSELCLRVQATAARLRQLLAGLVTQYAVPLAAPGQGLVEGAGGVPSLTAVPSSYRNGPGLQGMLQASSSHLQQLIELGSLPDATGQSLASARSGRLPLVTSEGQLRLRISHGGSTASGGAPDPLSLAVHSALEAGPGPEDGTGAVQGHAGLIRSARVSSASQYAQIPLTLHNPARSAAAPPGSSSIPGLDLSKLLQASASGSGGPGGGPDAQAQASARLRHRLLTSGADGSLHGLLGVQEQEEGAEGQEGEAQDEIGELVEVVGPDGRPFVMRYAGPRDGHPSLGSGVSVQTVLGRLERPGLPPRPGSAAVARRRGGAFERLASNYINPDAFPQQSDNAASGSSPIRSSVGLASLLPSAQPVMTPEEALGPLLNVTRKEVGGQAGQGQTSRPHSASTLSPGRLAMARAQEALAAAVAAAAVRTGSGPPADLLADMAAGGGAATWRPLSAGHNSPHQRRASSPERPRSPSRLHNIYSAASPPAQSGTQSPTGQPGAQVPDGYRVRLITATPQKGFMLDQRGRPASSPAHREQDMQVQTRWGANMWLNLEPGQGPPQLPPGPLPIMTSNITGYTMGLGPPMTGPVLHPAGAPAPAGGVLHQPGDNAPTNYNSIELMTRSELLRHVKQVQAAMQEVATRYTQVVQDLHNLEGVREELAKEVVTAREHWLTENQYNALLQGELTRMQKVVSLWSKNSQPGAAGAAAGGPGAGGSGSSSGGHSGAAQQRTAQLGAGKEGRPVPPGLIEDGEDEPLDVSGEPEDEEK